MGVVESLQWTRAEADVARVMLARHIDRAGEAYGIQVAVALGYPLDTLHPILRRFADEGLLIAREEERAVASRDTPKPPRYRLDPDRVREIQQRLDEADEANGIAWARGSGLRMIRW